MRFKYSIFVCLLFLAVCSGCNNSPATATVRGKVSFDGKPLADAAVVFNPVDGSRSSFGTTDASGNYTLSFSPTQKGAIPGEHSVDIRTAPGEPDPENPVKELLPEKYNNKTELKATLKRGSQTVDFDLKP